MSGQHNSLPVGGKMPYNSARYGKRTGHPAWFGKHDCDFFGEFPESGGFPKGFLKFAFNVLEVTNPDKVLYLCSGSINRGITVDIRPATNPTIVADARKVPLPSNFSKWIIIDPPYSIEYARNLYGTDEFYPKPEQLMREAARLLKPGGRIGFLHFQIPFFRGTGLKIHSITGISTGLGFAIRAFTVFEKPLRVKPK